MEKIKFTSDGTTEEFYVIADTKLSGDTYILVTDKEEGDADAWIFKQIGDGDEVVYEEVYDDDLLEALSNLFAADLEDIDIN